MAQIEIHQYDNSGCNGYLVWGERHGGQAVIASQVFEDHLADILTERQFQKFMDGEYIFKVPASRIFSTLGVMV